RAFVEVIAGFGSYYAAMYEQGERWVTDIVRAEEENLLAAWRLARAQGWWRSALAAMEALRVLYIPTGRRAAWRRLVDTVTPELVDPLTDRPRTGLEAEWNVITSIRAEIAQQDRDWEAAEQLQRASMEWTRAQAEPALAAPPETWDDTSRNRIRSLAAD